jgi:hypothetical protein
MNLAAVQRTVTESINIVALLGAVVVAASCTPHANCSTDNRIHRTGVMPLFFKSGVKSTELSGASSVNREAVKQSGSSGFCKIFLATPHASM